jgi:hypothetical protein
MVQRLARAVADMLAAAEAFGEAAADVWLSLPHGVLIDDSLRSHPPDMHFARDLNIPADEAEIAAFAAAWEREIARECGHPAWEGDAQPS